MKNKKNLKKLCVAFIGCSMLLALAACGANESSQREEGNTPIHLTLETENSQAPVEAESETAAEILTEVDESNAAMSEGICRLEAKQWVSGFDRTGLAAVKGSDGKVYIADANKGELVACLGDFGPILNGGNGVELKNITVVNGYVCGQKRDDIGSCYVWDRNGKQIYSPEDGIVTPVSKSGYCVQKLITEGLGGRSYTVQVIDVKGNVVFSMGPSTNFGDGGNYLGDDLFAFNKRNENDDYEIFYYDAASGATYAGDNMGSYQSDALVYYDGSYVKGFRENHSDSWPVVNQKYILNNDRIYDFQGNLVKDLTEGGVDDIYYMDGVYYVESKTGFLYTLDENFEYIAEPRKSEDEICGITKAGAVLAPKAGTLAAKVADKNLNCKELSFSVGSPVDVANDYVMLDVKGDEYLEYVKVTDLTF